MTVRVLFSAKASVLKSLFFIIVLGFFSNIALAADTDPAQALATALGQTPTQAATQTDPSAAVAAGAATGQWPGIPAVKYTPNADGSGEYTVTIQILAIMTVLSVLPSLLIMMTSFTRIIVVLANSRF